MTPEKWKHVKGIVEEAVELAPALRPAFLEKACSGDQDIRNEAESLLGFDNTDAQRLEQNPFASVFSDDLAAAFIGQEIGGYRIVSELGAGGMGTVFLAERTDGAFEQEVALKLIKRGMNSDAIIKRFINERQILASLKHPNIAHMIDGGTHGGRTLLSARTAEEPVGRTEVSALQSHGGTTDEGLPYFVMEYVEGETIVQFARSNDLDIEKRLDLFRQVCAAVSFAHQNLVIHRDLKPSNIFVNSDGVPKLLDFGIAKLLKNTGGGETATQHFVFTPEYASPEQVRGERLTTATDIYSLGVILYELLTGARPFSFEGKNFGQIIETTAQTEPLRPSEVVSRESRVEGRLESNGDRTITPPDSRLPTLDSRLLRGDLDNIILKALNKLPERRYGSVEQFSNDILRYLKGMPIFARQDTWRYRAGKFTRRNPLVVGAVALAFLILIAGIIATGYQARRADLERAKAERRFNDVRALANSFIFEVNAKIAESPIEARELLVTRAIQYLDTLADESDGDAGLQSELAAAYDKIGNVQSELFNPNLGKTSEALVSHRKALEIREKLLDSDPKNKSHSLDVVKSRVYIGNILSMSGRLGEARAEYQKAVEMGEVLRGSAPDDVDFRQSLALSYSVLGQSVLRSGSLGEALENYNRALAIYSRLADENPNHKGIDQSIGVISSYIGYVKMEMGDIDEAIRFFGESLSLMEKVDDGKPSSRGGIGIAHLWLGIALSQKEPDKGIVHIRRALEIQKTISEADPKNYGELNGLADCYLELGKALTIKAGMQTAARSSSTNEAVTAYQSAIKNYAVIQQNDPENLSVSRQIAFTRRNLGDAFMLNGNGQKAMEAFRDALAETVELTSRDPNNTEWLHDLAVCNLRIGEIYLDRGDRTHAVPYLAKAHESLQTLSGASPENVRIRNDLNAASKNLESRESKVESQESRAR